MPFENPTFVTQGAFQRLREIQGLLSAEGIATEIVQPPGAKANA